MALQMLHLTLLGLILCLGLNIVSGQSIQMKGTYMCDDKRRNGETLHLHFRAFDANSRATEMVPVDQNGIPLTVDCTSTGEILPTDPFIVDIDVNLANNQVDNDCGMEVVNPGGASPKYRWRFQARRVENSASIGTKHTLNVLCDSADLSNNEVSTVVELDVDQMSIDPTNEVNRIGDNGVQENSELTYTGLFYPGEEDDIPQCADAVGFFYYDCYSGTDEQFTPPDSEQTINENGCKIDTATYSPTSEFQRTSEPGTRPYTISAGGATAQYVNDKDTIYQKCKIGCCLDAGDECCNQRCGCTPTDTTISTVSTHTDFIVVKDELAKEMYGTISLTPPLEKKTVGNEGEQINFVAKITPGGVGTNADLMTAKGFAVFSCEYSTHRNFPNGQTTEFVAENGCIVPGTDFSPDEEFVANAALSSLNDYYVTSGLVTLKVQKKYKVYGRCGILICDMEGVEHCQQSNFDGSNTFGTIKLVRDSGSSSQVWLLSVPYQELCGATGPTDHVTRLQNIHLEWEMSIKASPSLSISPEDENDAIGENGVQLDSSLKFKGHFYPGEETDQDAQNAVGMFYADCHSGTNAQVNRDREMFIGTDGCPNTNAAYAPTSGFSRTSAADDRPFTIEATGATATYVEGRDNICFECRRGYCYDENDECCQQRCGCDPRQSTKLTDTKDKDCIIIKNELAQRMLGTVSLTHPLITEIVAEDGDEIYFVTQHIPQGIGTDPDLQKAKGFYVYSCRYSLDDTLPDAQWTPFVGANGCTVASDFTPDSEFVFDAPLSNAHEYYISSGKVKLKAQDKYTVYCKCKTGICLTNNHPRCKQQRCGATGAGVNENYEELGDKGLSYAIKIKKKPRLVILPKEEVDLRGPNTVIEEADIKYIGYFYPHDDINPGAVGYYYKNCYSGTNEAVDRDREQFINAEGCVISSAALRPTSPFRRISADGEVPIILEATFAQAQLVNNRGTIFCYCEVGYCLEETDENCQVQRCENTAVQGSTADTTNKHTGSITVIEAETAEQLVGSKQIATDPTQTVVNSGYVGDEIYLAAKLVPFGKGSNAVLQRAKGFFVYSCRYDTNQDVPDDTATVFVAANGCLVESDLTPESAFEFEEALSEDYFYVIVSGKVTLVAQNGYRVYFKCKTGICTTENHPHCQQRCGSTGSNNDVILLGDSGLEYDIGIIGTNDPPVALQVTAADGSTDLQTSGGFVGDRANFKAVVIPSQSDTGSQLSNAKGAFLHSCYATTNQKPHDEVPESDKEYFIDGNGCRIADSDFATSKECEGNVDSQPFVIDCGTFELKEKGNWKQTCYAGPCKEEDGLDFCRRRCRPGTVVPNSVQNATVPVSRGFRAKERNDRTAVVSEQKKALIIALACLLPAAVLLGVAIGACCLVHAQNLRK